MRLLAAVAAIWSATILFVVSLCKAATNGDRAESEALMFKRWENEMRTTHNPFKETS